MSTGDIHEESEFDVNKHVDAAFAKPLTGISIFSADGVGEEAIVFDQDGVPLGMIQSLELVIGVDSFVKLTLTYPNDRKRVVEKCALLRLPTPDPLNWPSATIE